MKRGVHLAKALGKLVGSPGVDTPRDGEKVNVPAALRCIEVVVASAFERDTPTRICCLRPTLKSRLSANSKVRFEPLLETPAPPVREGVVHDDRWRLRERRLSRSPAYKTAAALRAAMFLPTMPCTWARSWLLLLWGLNARSGRLKPPTPLFSLDIFAATVLETQRLVVVQRVFETDGGVGRVGRTAHVVAQAVAVLVERDDGVGLVVAAAVEVEANRRLALDDRTAQRRG